MCGRFTITVSYQELTKHLSKQYQIEIEENLFDVPRYNVAPGQEIISIINDGMKNRVGLLKWGFIPSFAKDEKLSFQMINAKAETIFEKQAFKEVVLSKRCVVLADSFYEWKKSDSTKIPMRILLQDQKVFSMAGIWNTYTKQDGKKVHTVSLVTTEANPFMSSIHDRMPVILDEQTEKIWLNPMIKDVNKLMSLLKPYSSEKMSMYPVSTLINKASYDAPDCIIETVYKEKRDLFE